MSRAREARELLRWAEAHGWELKRVTSSGHLFLRHRSGASVTMAHTPGDSRGMKNARADMRRELRKLGEDDEA